ncbi:fumarylacetoacetate hydrolase family protein [Tropicimonas sp. IMCC34011]|uniref:fumarylacetoacetate hydrolase family protein n=1 Tax=Tropicimonas sp. IMCC34011 TaxID=2248759 RepID=UPI000E2306BB|nr:fumarylacetoacetate hydrolase family protein [Tropicimonas sp. IMCC34011]
MRFATFARAGRLGWGALTEGGIVPVPGRGRTRGTLKGAIAGGLLTEAAEYAAGRPAEFALSDVTLLPPIPDPAKIFCIGVNYAAHREETGRKEVGHPTVFTRFADSQVGHGQAMVVPRNCERFDYEGELAVVIGLGGRHIGAKDAMAHVAGYSCYNDGSARDWQRHTSQFTPGKNHPGSGAFGPALVTPDEIGDYRELPIETRLNGEVVQQGKLDQLLFSIEEVIAYISGFTPLQPGDVIVTGTPSGVGERRDPPLYMKAGDVVEVSAGAVGTLVNPVVQAD